MADLEDLIEQPKLTCELDGNRKLAPQPKACREDIRCLKGHPRLTR